MFRWCSFCQHLIGEAPPLNRFEVTHGFCDRCAERFGTQDPSPSVLRAKALFDKLEAAARSGDFDAMGQTIDEAVAAGLRPSEIMIGALHPLLARVGELWEAGEMTIAEEHRITQFASRFIEKQLHYLPLRRQESLVLLAPFEGSFHEIGLSMLQHLTWERGIACHRLPVGTSGDEIINAVADLKPQLVGLLVSLVDVIPRALGFARELAKVLPPGCELVLGGHAFRQADAPSVPTDLIVLTTTDRHLERLDRIGDGKAAPEGSP